MIPVLPMLLTLSLLNVILTNLSTGSGWSMQPWCAHLIPGACRDLVWSTPMKSPNHDSQEKIGCKFAGPSFLLQKFVSFGQRYGFIIVSIFSQGLRSVKVNWLVTKNWTKSPLNPKVRNWPESCHGSCSSVMGVQDGCSYWWQNWAVVVWE